MHVAFDLDGVIDAYPRQMQTLMSALLAAGHTVTVLTGNGAKIPGTEDYQEKQNFLNSLGCGACYDFLVVLNNTTGASTAQEKAEWCENNHVDMLIDNTKDNADAANNVDGLCALVPWATRE
jgi:hypothetical protein